MSVSPPPAAMVVMAKHPVPGEVKTRMCPPLSLDEAAELYAAMLDDVLEATASAARSVGAGLWLAGHPPEALGALGRRCPEGTRLLAQRGPDLGARMEAAVADVAGAGFGNILLRGSDSPALAPDALVAGLEALAGCDLSVGPDADGGYAWIALRRPLPGLFQHPMSTASALRDTLSGASAAGLRCRRLPPSFDLDTASDLALLRSARGRGEAGACPRTLALLDARDHWRHLG